MERILARSRTPTVVSGGGGAASPGPAVSTPDRAAGGGDGAGLGPSPGVSAYERRGAQGEPHVATPVRGPPPAAGAYQQQQQSHQQFAPPPGLSTGPSAVELALLRQGDLIAEAVGKMNAKGTSQGSAIKVQPQVKWP